MKKLFLFATAVLMLTACKEDGQETGPVIPREINILLEDDIFFLVTVYLRFQAG